MEYFSLITHLDLKTHSVNTVPSLTHLLRGVLSSAGNLAPCLNQMEMVIQLIAFLIKTTKKKKMFGHLHFYAVTFIVWYDPFKFIPP